MPPRLSEPNPWGQHFPLDENGQLRPQDYFEYTYGPWPMWNQPIPNPPLLQQPAATQIAVPPVTAPLQPPPAALQASPVQPPPLPATQPAATLPPNATAPAALGGIGVGRFAVLVPRNTGGQASLVRLEFQVGTSPAAFLDRICNEMGIDKASALLGYKLPKDKQTVEARHLADEESVRNVIQEMEGAASRARSNVPELRIVDLNPPSPAATSTSTGKRKREDSNNKENEVPMISEEVLENSKKLKARYKCALHSKQGRWCFITTSADGSKVEHVELDTIKMAYWAQAWALSKASLFDPPHGEGFDWAVKKARKSRSTTEAGPSTATTEPLGERNGPAPPADRACDSDSDDDLPLAFPTIATILDRLHQAMPANNYPKFTEAMQEKGVYYVNNVVGLDRSFWIDQVGMPAGAVGPFLDFAAKQVQKTKKQANRALT